MSLEYREEQTDQPGAEELPHVRIPIPYYTIILLVCMAAVFLAQLSAGLERSALIAGFVKPAFLFDNEYWRILTGAALHGSFPHILMNGYAFYSFGRLMELLTNRAHLAMVFLLSAVGGGILSLIFHPEGISVGASGGIVGVIGYLLIYAFRRRNFVSAGFRKSLIFNIGFILIFGLVLNQIIDNYGHIGGLVTGIIYGLIQIPSDEYENPQNAGRVAKAFGILALVIYAGTSAFAILRLMSVR
ncbi:MAG TPA: rhomboid family intramembrane serine protease [Pyrinomonadaceae bacterium]|nr:rhomboid family intramembrane serine protease [Pyrinomonadaceae bacterium]